MHTTLRGRFLFVVLWPLLTAGSLSLAQEGDISIIEEQGRGLITLSARNTGERNYEVTIDVESSGLDINKQIPYTGIVQAGQTVVLLKLTPRPGQAYRYRYSTQYSEYSGPIELSQDPNPPAVTSEMLPPPVPVERPVEQGQQVETKPVPSGPDVVPQESAHQTTEHPVVMESASPAPSVSQTPPPAVRQSMEGKPLANSGITLYTRSDCMKCRDALQYLNALNVNFKEVNIDADQSGAKAMWSQLFEQGYGGPVDSMVIARGTHLYVDSEDPVDLLAHLINQ